MATGELVAPVVGSTLTTVVVFAPLGLLSGVVGQFFKALSLTLSVAVLISLLLALFLIPLLARFTIKADTGAARAAAAPSAPHEHHTGRIERMYLRALPAFLGRPIVIVLAALVLGGAAVGTYFQVGTGFLPAADEGGFVIDYVAPAGMALEDTDHRLKQIEIDSHLHARSRELRAPHRLGNGPVCDADE